MTLIYDHNLVNAFDGTFVFFATAQTNAKKSKRATMQPHQRQQTMDSRTSTEKEQRRHISTYPKGGGSCSADTFVQAESSILRMKFSGKSPALLVAAKRCGQLFGQI